MNRETVHILNRINESFYLANGTSFDRTRRSAWQGWGRVVGHLVRNCTENPLHVLDVACGNMRFERHLLESMPETTLQAVCVDSCDDLAVEVDGCAYRHMDIVEALARDTLPESCFGTGFDLVVSFGFFHHVPDTLLRARLLQALVDAARTDGLIALSLWRFASDAKMLEKARRTTEEAVCGPYPTLDLDEGDYLLGWDGLPGAYRYCHSFDSGEIDALVSEIAPSAFLVDRFRADGRTGALNEYLVFQKR